MNHRQADEAGRGTRLPKLLRLAARVTGTLLFAMVCVIMVGEGGPPNPLKLSPEENLQMAGFAVFTVGLVVGWWRVGLAAAMVLGGLAFFYVVELVATGSLPGGAFPLFFIPGLLYLAAHVLARRSWPTQQGGAQR